jgi:tetratricopeptide (TPR) repeat protein
MLADRLRFSARGPYPLDDWLLPVLYQQDPLEFDFAIAAKRETTASHLPPDVKEYRDAYGFIGRDGPILQMVRALHRRAPCVLICGLGGVGKTTLARGLLRWLDETGGLDGAQWFDFRDIRTAEYVLNRTGEIFYGENFGIATNKLQLLADALKPRRFLIVWDNFESAADNLTNQDRTELAQFLDAIRGTRSKVIMTSRSSEEWLGPSERFEVKLGGLDGNERWEYCEVILRELGLKVNRDDPELSKLMDQLGGHPLAMRVLLPKLEHLNAGDVAQAIRTNMDELGLSEQGEQGRLFATLRFVEQGLPEDLRPLMRLVALHETHLHPTGIEEMAKQVDPAWTRARIDRLMEALSGAGLVWNIGKGLHEMHPLLTNYLRSRGAAPEICQRAFVETMGNAARGLRPLPHHEQRMPFSWHRNNLHAARHLAANLAMDQEFAALTEAIGAHALNSRDFVTASRLFAELAQHSAIHTNAYWEGSAHYNLGRIAQESQDFEAARQHYLKSLAVCEEDGDLNGIAAAYHQLGIVAERQRRFDTAREWHGKSIAVREKQNDLQGIAGSYHQLGRIAEEQRDVVIAQEWYLKSVAISEKHNNLDYAASTYHQLGTIALEQHHVEAAHAWYLKSLEISAKHNNLHGMAKTYHQLGRIAHERRDFETARDWCIKSLAISEKQGNFHEAACTYHQLGMIATDQRAFGAAREWYLKSVAIKEKQSDLNDVASTYYQLGVMALEQLDFEAAQEWYLKSLVVWEKNGNWYGRAQTYSELGILASQTGHMEDCGAWYTRSIRIFRDAGDQPSADRAIEQLLFLYDQMSAEDKQAIRAIWQAADLGEFPREST